MAALEQLIRDVLIADSQLAALLATYAGVPAVFTDQAPGTQAPAWSASQRPMIVITVDRSYNPARSLDGGVNLLVAAPDAVLPAILSRLVQDLDERLWLPTGEAPQVTRIRQENLSPEMVDEQAHIVEQDVAFDLIALVPGATWEPDPVAAAIAWSELLWGGSPLLLLLPSGLQTDPARWGATDLAPALYWRAASWEGTPRVALLDKGRVLRRWNVELRAHVLSQDPAQRLAWARSVADGLSVARSIQLADGSWMDMVSPPRMDPSADPARDGQVSVGMNFRTVSVGVAVPPLRRITGQGDMSPVAVTPA